MKKIIFISVILSLGFISCYEDQSTDASIEIGEIKVSIPELGEPFSLVEIQQGLVYSVNTTITKDGDSNPDLSYEWRLNLMPRVEDYVVLSRDKDINEPIVRRPNSLPYTLWLVITDHQTNLQHHVYWDVRIISTSGDGLIVADTKDGMTSDISLVRSRYFSSGYTGEVLYKRNNFSAANGFNINGLVKKIQFGKTMLSNMSTYKIFTLTEDDFFSIDPETYMVASSYDQLFVNPPSVKKPQAFSYSINQHMIYVDDGRLYFINYGQGSQSDIFTSYINYTAPGSTQIKYYVSDYIASVTAYDSFMTYYDETLSRFACVKGGLFSNLSFSDVTYDESVVNAYNPLSMPNMQPLSAGVGTNGVYMHALKDKTTGEIAFYSIIADYDENSNQVFKSASKYATQACPDIDQAISFETCENKDVVYYATPSAVYSAYFSASSVSATSRFTPPAGEVITTIKLFHEAWYVLNAKDDYTPMNENGNQLFVATYNETTQEGKVYALAITNLAGALEASSVEKTFGGFSRITALGTQGK
ncbi:hypothetical protein JGH11_13190 [Dysgonomonas sp. Marseille-P4677]|uniref:PKD-like family lipoprotein n=1 Tax=Dysgonomonas sp. Marseille-P4677 TaxID=2364790 RepID=UPI00191476E0|nr:PKD-like family lipoprotein [Dysgonomonas sp. Marseille-P4677]MBK5721828.1 hypothetical protein [Dysgonomonas sp. Marseille-P4677]